MVGDYLAIFPAVIGGLIVTGLFLWGLYVVATSPSARRTVIEVAKALGVHRADDNPILRPGIYPWEAAAVMNPGVAQSGGRTHLFYRALGSDGISRIGYASSEDGIHFDERLPYPVFSLDGPDPKSPVLRSYMERMYPRLVASGGGWGGVEDPRAVIIDDRLYLSFSAFYNWSSLRVGVVSLSVDDLLSKRWRWSPPVFISPEYEVHKNWVIFPEKINGKFAILHSLHSGRRDRVLVDYLDSLNHVERPIHSSYEPTEQDDAWDRRVRGAGPPPIKTDKGWVLLYHANDQEEPHKYKLGALLLDLNDPTRVLARSRGPVLSPEAYYENEGKPGVIYACGAVVRENLLRVYYGGADVVICTATILLPKLMETFEPI